MDQGQADLLVNINMGDSARAAVDRAAGGRVGRRAHYGVPAKTPVVARRPPRIIWMD